MGLRLFADQCIPTVVTESLHVMLQNFHKLNLPHIKNDSRQYPTHLGSQLKLGIQNI